MSISKATHAVTLGIALVLSLAASEPARSEERVVPETYTATTANMTPENVEIKADIIRWSTDTERENVIAALQSEEPSAVLAELPSMGVIWSSNSSVGNSVKYAHRSETADGGETVTFVTDRPIGYSHFSPWTADAPGTGAALEYTVVEMTLDEANEGQGTLSLSADVVIDQPANRISLDSGAQAPLLMDARMAPKPYWARQD